MSRVYTYRVAVHEPGKRETARDRSDAHVAHVRTESSEKMSHGMAIEQALRVVREMAVLRGMLNGVTWVNVAVDGEKTWDWRINVAEARQHEDAEEVVFNVRVDF